MRALDVHLFEKLVKSEKHDAIHSHIIHLMGINNNYPLERSRGKSFCDFGE